MIFIIFFSIVLLLIVLLFINWSYGKDAPYYPIEPDTVFRALEMVNPQKSDIIYELGSGDARNIIGATLKYHCRAVGVEINKLRVYYSRFWIWILRLSSQIQIVHQDVFKVDLSPATIIITYLLPETHQKLKEKLTKELKPGIKILAIAFPIDNWTPTKVNPHGSIFGPIYLYEIGKSNPK